MSTELALQKYNSCRYIAAGQAPATVTQTSYGPAVDVRGEEIPVLDVAFDVRIVQPGSGQKTPSLIPVIGKFLVVMDNDHPEEVNADTLNVRPVSIIGYRYNNYGPYGEDNGGRRICWSDDGLRPSPRCETPIHHACAEAVARGNGYSRNVICPRASWADGTKPECRESVILGFFDLDRKVPLRMSLHGSALGAWNKFNRDYALKSAAARIKRKDLDNDYYWKITLENKGTYFVPTFALVESGEEYGDLRDWLPLCGLYNGTVFAVTQGETSGTGGGGAQSVTASTHENNMGVVADESIVASEEAAQEFEL